MNSQADFLTRPPFGLLMGMAAPSSIAFFLQASVSLAEVWFIGQLGASALAAIALAFPLLMLNLAMSGGALGGAVSAAIARAYGAGDIDAAERLIWHAFGLALLGWLAFLLAFVLFGAGFLALLGGSQAALDGAVAYCGLLFAGGLFIWLMGTTTAIFRGVGMMKTPALLMLVNAAIQVPLSGCLVLGLFGFPAMGVAGAAISAIASAAIVGVILIGLMATGHLPVRLRLSACRFSPVLLRHIMQVFLPASLSPFLNVATIIALTAIVGQFGETALAGYGIGSRIEFLMIPLIFGLGAAMTSLVGINVGAGQIARAEKIGWIGGATAALIASFIGVFLSLTPEYWIPVFADDAAVTQVATRYFSIVGPWFGFYGFGLSLYFAAQGAGKMFWPISATMLRVVLAVGGGWLCAVQLEVGLDGVFAAAAFAMVAYGGLIGLSLHRGAWRAQTV